ncbi:MAG: N-formylglutamate amidohydrolase [Candidatus Omnitrophica bacterium]|nr:N-formylglutamate amidohydrolase [bacterium]MCL4735539.1 N-formylglutamate amidohydrolase [Candidatus Omnitrophota bacterium]NUP93153.1 N-formylglutamate amidohydrolase [Candidatus Omnitrophota bacterium]
MAPKKWELLITCEHAGNRIPAGLKALFQGRDSLIQSHRGYDIGAIKMAAVFSAKLDAPLFFSKTSRLVCDLNRSLGNPTLFSSVTQPLSQEVKHRILEQHYFPHRRRVESHIETCFQKKACLLHLAVHSFTPVLAGKVRRTDIGLLYDPKRNLEALFCRAWQKQIRLNQHGLSIHLNAPYRGISDGFATYLRKKYPASRYIGIELEVNNRLLDPPLKTDPEITSLLLETFSNIFREDPWCG